jgi:hypothetical protein
MIDCSQILLRYCDAYKTHSKNTMPKQTTNFFVEVQLNHICSPILRYTAFWKCTKLINFEHYSIFRDSNPETVFKKLLRRPGIDSRIGSVSLYVAMRARGYHNPIPLRFLTPINSSKIPAQAFFKTSTGRPLQNEWVRISNQDFGFESRPSGIESIHPWET